MFNETPSLTIEQTPPHFERQLNPSADAALKIAQINSLALKAETDLPAQAIHLKALASTACLDITKAADVATIKNQTQTVQTSQQIEKISN